MVITFLRDAKSLPASSNLESMFLRAKEVIKVIKGKSDKERTNEAKGRVYISKGGFIFMKFPLAPKKTIQEIAEM